MPNLEPTPEEAMRRPATFEVLERELAALGARSGGADRRAFWVPGRIEVLGKHTDYGGGRSLLCAVERGVSALVEPRQAGAPNERLVRIRDAKSGQTARFDLTADAPRAPGSWSNYPITVARRIAANFDGPLRGADIVFWSDIPHAAGVSSSSALVVMTFLALGDVNGLASHARYRAAIRSSDDLAGYLGAVENGLDFGPLHGSHGVGTFGGSEDHTAILSARAGQLVQYRFCPVTFERAIPLPEHVTFVVGASGVQAEKTGAALERYNDVARRLGAALACWRRATGRHDASMGAALASASDAGARLRAALGSARDADYPPGSLIERVEQFDAESNDIIPAAADALARGDLAAFGAQVERSQAGAERALHNQVPETIALVRRARELGACAASAFGAGFGGSVWALVERIRADEFRDRWASAYRAQFPDAASHAEFFVTGAGPAAARLSRAGAA